MRQSHSRARGGTEGRGGEGRGGGPAGQAKVSASHLQPRLFDERHFDHDRNVDRKDVITIPSRPLLNKGGSCTKLGMFGFGYSLEGTACFDTVLSAMAMQHALTIPLAVAAGVTIGSALSLTLPRLRKRRLPNLRNLALLRSGSPTGGNCGVYFNSEDAPSWLRGLFFDPSIQRVLLREWEDLEWRRRSGWHGSDLIHDPYGSAVRVLAYFWSASTMTLVGIVHFGAAAESHRGLCHGGAMTSLMDDFCGHICFIAGGAPWCGATVQVNCKLMKPVCIGDTHKIIGRIDKQETKDKNGKLSTKVFITAELVGEHDHTFASLEGLSITPVAMREVDDAVTQRSWISERGTLTDSGWLLD
ncbi:MAG: hypothetical protein SGPRY_004012 [Prymnesium sp.]